MDDKSEILNLVRVALEEWFGPSRANLAAKWHDGKVIIQSGNAAMQPKEIPIETFLHKIVMVRESLRVLEQKINQNEGLSDEDKVQLQQYITRCYGSLTTFNVLFRDDHDKFVGQKG